MVGEQAHVAPRARRGAPRAERAHAAPPAPRTRRRSGRSCPGVRAEARALAISFGGTRTRRSPWGSRRRSRRPETWRQSSIGDEALGSEAARPGEELPRSRRRRCRRWSRRGGARWLRRGPRRRGSSCAGRSRLRSRAVPLGRLQPIRVGTAGGQILVRASWPGSYQVTSATPRPTGGGGRKKLRSARDGRQMRLGSLRRRSRGYLRLLRNPTRGRVFWLRRTRRTARRRRRPERPGSRSRCRCQPVDRTPTPPVSPPPCPTSGM